MIQGLGHFIVTCFDGSSTSVITTNYSGLRAHKDLYKGKPSSVYECCLWKNWYYKDPASSKVFSRIEAIPSPVKLLPTHIYTP